jgi:peptidoglycan/xylan/chitin deacetylase (PgdA/CDA1 family)
MPSKLLIGYDVERIPGRVPGEKWVGRKVPADSTSTFLKRIVEIHSDLQVPATIFMLGCNIEKHLKELEKCIESGMFEIAQHTYDHYPLKTINEETGSQLFLKGLDFDRIEEQIAKPVNLLKKYLGIECKGLTAPYTYYRGLSDRPDILEIISRYNITYTRSYGRNHLDYFPLDWNIQPFFYEKQGFPEILEIPVQGWLDAQWRHDNGWDKQQEYYNYLKDQVDILQEKDLCWSHLQHDWTSILCDKQLEWTKKILEYATDKIEIMTHYDYYKSFKTSTKTVGKHSTGS